MGDGATYCMEEPNLVGYELVCIDKSLFCKDLGEGKGQEGHAKLPFVEANQSFAGLGRIGVGRIVCILKKEERSKRTSWLCILFQREVRNG
jgi:hypothetical protein